MIGFAGAFRRSELVGLNVDDLEHVRQGIILRLRRSKTDQQGRGEKIGIPLGAGDGVPLQRWRPGWRRRRSLPARCSDP